MSLAAQKIHDVTLGTYAIPAGLTPLVPIPFVDAAVARRVQRAMFERVAREHGRELSRDDSLALTEAPKQSALDRVRGAAGTVAVYPLRWVFRRVVLALLFKDVTDLAAKTYVYGLAFDLALSEGWLDEHGPARVGQAIAAAGEAVGTSPVERALKSGLEVIKREGPKLLKRFGVAIAQGEDHGAAKAAQPAAEAFAQALGPMERVREGLAASMRATLGVKERRADEPEAKRERPAVSNGESHAKH